MREKRHHERLQITLQIQIEAPGMPAHSAVVKDLGQGGAFVESAQALAYGSEITLLISLPGETQPLRVPCTVRWSKPEGFGVQFGLLGAKETHAIARLLKG